MLTVMLSPFAYIKMKNLKLILALASMLVALLLPARALASASSEGEGGFNPKEIIFEHLGDGYGWEVPFDHHHRIPLPVMVWAQDGSFHCFSSSHVNNHAVYVDGD